MKTISIKKAIKVQKKVSAVGKGAVARRAKAADDREVVPPGEAPDLSTPAGRKKAWQIEQKEATARRHAEAERRNLEREANDPVPNPLFKLGEEERAKLFAWLRECPYDDAVQHILRGQGLENVSPRQLSEFFQQEAESHWEKRIERATAEANALVQLAEKNQEQFSSGILAALGQEAFRLIASGDAQPESLNKLTMLFLRARSDKRAEKSLKLRRKKLKRDGLAQTERALNAFARELPKNPVAFEAFEELKRQLLDQTEHLEEAS